MDPHEEALSRKYVGRRVKNLTVPFGENEFLITKIDTTSFTSDEAIKPRTVVYLRSFRGEICSLDLEMLLDPRGPWQLLDTIIDE